MDKEKIRAAVEISKESVGYLMQKYKQFNHLNSNNARIFKDRAESVQITTDLAEKYLKGELIPKPSVGEVKEILQTAHCAWLEKKSEATNIIDHYATAISKEIGGN